MNAMEFARGRESALGLTMAPDSVEAFAADIREAKAALFAWKRKHQTSCAMVMFTIVTDPANHEGIQATLDRACRDEGQLAPLLQGLRVDVALLNPSGKPAKQYTLGQNADSPRGVPTSGASSKPWWKFW
jgi:hypothetical protein